MLLIRLVANTTANAIMFYIGLRMPVAEKCLSNGYREKPYKIFGHSLSSLAITIALILIDPLFIWMGIGHAAHILLDFTKKA